MYLAPLRLFKPNVESIELLLGEEEFALGIFPIGVNTKVLTNKRLLFLDVSDSNIKEFISLENVVSFAFSSMLGTPRVDALMKDGGKIKIGSLDQKILADVQRVMNDAVGTSSAAPDVATNNVHLPEDEDAGAVSETADTVRTNSQKAFPKWLQASIHKHKRDDDSLVMLITEPYTNHQGALLVFEDRCMIVKGGFVGGFMAGSLGGERAGTFYFSQITGIEYNSGLINGVLEILTPSYQGTANKDFWRGSTKSRNADRNDPWTLSNCLPLTKDGYNSARGMIDELKKKIAESQAPRAPQVIASASISDELGKLAVLHSQGALSDEEFQAAKSKLLG